jgi:hypothetical protein
MPWSEMFCLAVAKPDRTNRAGSTTPATTGDQQLARMSAFRAIVFPRFLVTPRAAVPPDDFAICTVAATRAQLLDNEPRPRAASSATPRP